MIWWWVIFTVFILAMLAYGTTIPPDKIYVRGIENITSRDFEFAKKLGYTIKLLVVIRCRQFHRRREGVPHTERTGFHELPFRADGQIANPILSDTVFPRTALNSLRPPFELSPKSEASFDIVKQSIGQSQRNLPVPAGRVPVIGGSGFGFEMPGFDRVGIVDTERTSCKGHCDGRKEYGYRNAGNLAQAQDAFGMVVLWC